MTLNRSNLVALMMTLACCGLAYGEDKADSREKLETIIPLGVKQLESKDYAKFLKTFVAPEDYELITKNVAIDEFAKKFGEERSAPLLKILKSHQGCQAEARKRRQGRDLRHQERGPGQWKRDDHFREDRQVLVHPKLAVSSVL